MERNRQQEGIQMNLFQYFNDVDSFTLKEAQDAVLNHYKQDVKVPSIRARIYEGIDKGLFTRVSKGVYTVTKKDEKGNESTCLLINGNGRDLSMIEDDTISVILNDHPYRLEKSHQGGNRQIVDYDTFRYEIDDFKEKYRVLKPGGFMVEMLPERNSDNIEYINDILKMAKECNYEKSFIDDPLHPGYKIEHVTEKPGFDFYSVVPWEKGSFVINQGRKAKNTEDIYFFTKGKARELKLDNKKNLKLAKDNNIELTSKLSDDVAKTLMEHGIQPKYMSGTNGMLPTTFNFQPASQKNKIHKAEKPIELYEEILSYVAVPGEKVLDQFAGSGNSGIAAINRGLDAILIEKDESVFNTMKKNIENVLESKAVLVQEINDSLEKINQNEEEIKTIPSFQLEHNISKLENEIAEKENKVKELSAEIECYTEVLESRGIFDKNENNHEEIPGSQLTNNYSNISKSIDDKIRQAESQKEEKLEKLEPAIDLLSVKPWYKQINDEISYHRIYVKAIIGGIRQDVYFDCNHDVWCTSRKEAPLFDTAALEKEIMKKTGIKNTDDLKHLKSVYSKNLNQMVK